jgi:cytoskeletal protein CcmA (bactofilin family)
MVDVSKFGDMVIRDINVRSITTTANSVIGGNVDVKGSTLLAGNVEIKGDTQLGGNMEILGDIKIKGNLIVEGETIAPPSTTSDGEFKSIVICDEQPKWRIVAIDDFLIFQKLIDGEWVNKQALS